MRLKKDKEKRQTLIEKVLELEAVLLIPSRILGESFNFFDFHYPESVRYKDWIDDSQCPLKFKIVWFSDPSP